MKIRLGISPCPNDTFAFHAILARRIDLRGFEIDAELVDVQTLNEGLEDSRYDIAKASFHAALLLADRYDVLGTGSALGFGVGPLLVAAHEDVAPQPARCRTARPPPSPRCCASRSPTAGPTVRTRSAPSARTPRR